MQYQKPTDEQLHNRFMHHIPTGNQGDRYSLIRATILGTAKLIVSMTPCSPEQARSLNALDEAMMLANAAIARNENPENSVVSIPESARPTKLDT